MTTCSAFGGMESHTLHLAAMLRDRGHRVTILQWGHSYFERAPAEQLEGITVVTIASAASLSQAGVFELWTVLRRWKGWTAIAPKGWFPDGSLRFDLVARLIFRRYITVEHSCVDPRPALERGRPLFGIVPRTGLWWYSRRWRDRLRGLAPHVVVAVSEAVRKGLLDVCGFHGSRVVTVLNGVDLERYSRDESARRSLRDTLNIGDDTLLFGVVGRLTPKKNVELAISAFAAAAGHPAAPDARLLIVGEGESASSLKAFARSLRIDEKIVFRGFTGDVRSVYSAVDVLLLPSLKEGLPLALLEAMACECASVANDVGGVPEVIGESGLGALVKTGDAAAFERAVQDALDGGVSDAIATGGRARQHVAARFDMRQQFSTLVRLLEQQGTYFAEPAAVAAPTVPIATGTGPLP